MARYLLDTNALLWLFWNDPRLGPRAHEVIADPVNEKFVSPVSLYEIAYKSARRRLEREVPEDLGAEVAGRGFGVLYLSAAHAERAGRMLYPNLSPNNRMLSAQALLEGLILITADADLLRYDVPTLDASR